MPTFIPSTVECYTIDFRNDDGAMPSMNRYLTRYFEREYDIDNTKVKTNLVSIYSISDAKRIIKKNEAKTWEWLMDKSLTTDPQWWVCVAYLIRDGILPSGNYILI